MRRSDHLPPLHSLRAFEAVGRLLSFRRAGEELLISQSAISHHIRQLELHLGTRLFERKARTVHLTESGKTLYSKVRDAFALIAEGVLSLRSAASQTVRVSLLPSFAANWLVPRLPRFQQDHPDVDLLLDPTLRLVDVAAGEADLAIRYGDGNWPGVDVNLLMPGAVTPVMSPALAQSGAPLRSTQDLLEHTLLLSRSPDEWTTWAAAYDVDLAWAHKLQLVDYNIVLQAALDGLGVALGRLALVEDRLRAGSLVAPLPDAISSDGSSYWTVTRRDRSNEPATDVFRTWLKAQGEREQVWNRASLAGLAPLTSPLI